MYLSKTLHGLVAIAVLFSSGCFLDEEAHDHHRHTDATSIDDGCGDACNGDFTGLVIADDGTVACAEYAPLLFESGVVSCSEDCVPNLSSCVEIASLITCEDDANPSDYSNGILSGACASDCDGAFAGLTIDDEGEVEQRLEGDRVRHAHDPVERCHLAVGA